MKSKGDIEKRLRKLRLRYAHKHVQYTQERRFHNCQFNEAQIPRKLPYQKTQSTDMSMAPRAQTTLVVIPDRDSTSVHLCMFGAGDPTKWQGNTCESDDIARSCPMFKPRVGIENSKKEFLELLGNDEYVFDNYRDVATLQWVLGERVHERALNWFERLILWFRFSFIKVLKPTPRLPESSLPEDLWNDSPPNS